MTDIWLNLISLNGFDKIDLEYFGCARDYYIIIYPSTYP